MKKFTLLSVLILIGSISFAQTKWMMINKVNGQTDSILATQIDKITFETKANTLLDIDGNLYHTVVIGTQEWTVENLRVTHYNDGVPIPNVIDGTDWANLSTGAYCAYNNDEDNVPTYGYLYNWYAVDTGKLATATGGWRVPTDADWTVLTDFLGGNAIAGGKLKATTGWYSNGNGTDIHGFNALPGGGRGIFEYFNYLGSYGFWWSSTAVDTNNAWGRYIHSNANVYRINNDDQYGLSVRLVRDISQ